MTWLPIESAPRDCSDFLAYSDTRKEYGVAYITERGGFQCPTSYGEDFTPTHWMPLPAPPESP